MKNLLLLALFLILSGKLFSQDLPHYMTDEEKIIWQNYQFPQPTEDINPPPGPVRTMAEWEELEGVIITWTTYTSILRQIVDYAQEEGMVWIVCTDSNTVKSYLTSGGVPLYNIKYLITSFNSVWVRDYGPWTVYSNVADTHRVIDWKYNRPRPLDDVIPVFFANYMGLPYHQTTTPPNDFIATGGNFMTDGHGTGFSSKLILNENSGKTEAQINQIMNSYMGITRYIKMENLPYDQIHHIDMHMKLLDEETLLVGQYPPGVADGPQIEANLQYVLNNFQTCFGRPYKVVRIPMPPGSTGAYPPSGPYRTFTNSIIINKTVIVPVYQPQYDTTALRIYREAMPGYNIVGIDCNQTISALGAIHCIVKEVGSMNPLFISHAKMEDTVRATGPYQVKAYFNNKSGIASASVYWTVDTTLGFSPLQMSPLSGDTLAAYIPWQPNGTKIYYYISAESNNGQIITKPMTAPAGHYNFYIDYTPLTFPLTVNVVNGWNMVSIAGNHPINQNIENWWQYKDPTAGVFKYQGGYQPVTAAVPGTGYWMKHSGPRTYNTGDEWPAAGFLVVPHLPITGYQGWNLFGGYEQSVSTASITTNPAGLISGSVYNYSGGYNVATTLEPGYGYWVKLTGQGQINIPSGPDAPTKIMETGTDNFGQIIITDNSSKSYTLYAVNSDAEISADEDLDRYELPPLPPEGMFDIRYSSQRYVERINNTRVIEMTGVEYPVKVKTEKTGIILSDESGREIARLKAGEEITINSSSGKLIVSENLVPAEYALGQNYPNPFNPGTTIQFSIPEDVQNVRVTIYSALGEKVAELVNESLQAGYYQYKWDGGSFASGMYIYQIVTEKFVSTKKMMLLK